MNRTARECLVNVEVRKDGVHIGRWAIKINVPSGLSRLQRADFEVGRPDPFPLFPNKRRGRLDRIPSFDQMTMERSHVQSGFGWIQWFEYVRNGL